MKQRALNGELSPQEAFGDMLRQVRGFRSLTPEELAARANIPLSRILRFESGMTEPTLSEVFALSRALGARPSSIIEGTEFLIGMAEPMKGRSPMQDSAELRL
jgi:transcriptional regulator with XRE-family HTH domain